jgi:hypothetical protein
MIHTNRPGLVNLVWQLEGVTKCSIQNALWPVTMRLLYPFTRVQYKYVELGISAKSAIKWRNANVNALNGGDTEKIKDRSPGQHDNDCRHWNYYYTEAVTVVIKTFRLRNICPFVEASYQSISFSFRPLPSYFSPKAQVLSVLPTI